MGYGCNCSGDCGIQTLPACGGFPDTACTAGPVSGNSYASDGCCWNCGGNSGSNGCGCGNSGSNGCGCGNSGSSGCGCGNSGSNGCGCGNSGSNGCGCGTRRSCRWVCCCW